MACEVQINSITYLQKQGAINDVNKIIDEDLFNSLNDKMTSLAELKYGLDAYGEKLFTTRLSQALPNNGLFEIFQDKFNQMVGRPMMMRTPAKSPATKLASTIYEINPNISETKIKNIYDNYVNLMDRARKGKAMPYKTFKSLTQVYQVYNYKDTYIFGQWDPKNAVFITRVNSSPNSKELLAEAIPNLVSKGLDFISFVPEDVAKKYERSGYSVSNAAFEYNFKGENMKKYAAVSNQNVANKIFNKSIEDITVDDLLNYDESIQLKYTPLQIDADLITKAGKDASAVLQTYLSGFGITVKDISEMKSRIGIDEFGFADMISKIIYTKDKQSIGPLAGEFIAYMMQHNNLIKDIIVELSKTDDYKGLSKSKYFKLIGELITQDLQNKIDKKNSVSLLNLIKQLIKKFFNIVSKVNVQLINTNIGIITNNILQQNKKLVTASLYKPGAIGKAVSQVSIEEALSKDKFGASIVKQLSKEGFILTGSTSLAAQGTVYRPDENPLHDIDWISPFTLEETISKFLKVYPDAIFVRTISENDNYRTDSYIIAPEGHSIKDYKVNKYIDDKGIVKTIIDSYNVVDKNGKIVGTYRNVEGQEIVEGIEGKVIDFFIYDNYKRMNRNDPFSYTTNEGYTILLANWKDTFNAKLNWARYKDIWDYNRFVPNVNIKEDDSNMMQFGVPLVDINIEMLNNARSQQLAEVLAQRLSLGLKVDYQNVTQEQAADILKNRAVKYNGEPAFYYAGTVYLVGENINPRTVVHEFAHPLLQALRIKNNILFNNMYSQLLATEEGQGIKQYVLTNYPELTEGSEHFKEEMLAYALQLKALNKINNQIETEGFEGFVNKLLAAIKKILRGIFGSKVNVSKMDVDTSIEELADMLLEKEFELDIPAKLTEEDLVMFARDVIDRAKSLDSLSTKQNKQEIIEQFYDTARRILIDVENFKGDKQTKKLLRESLFRKGTNRYLPEVQSNLRDYLNTDIEGLSEDELIQNALEAAQAQNEAELQRATALVNNLDIVNIMLKNMLSDISKINKTNINSRSSIALLMTYKQNAKAWLKMVEAIDEVLSLDGEVVDSSNPFYESLNEIVQNITRVNTNIARLLKNNNIQFYVEITSYMSQYVQERLRDNLGVALKKTFSPEQMEKEVNDLYNKVVKQELTEEDIDALVKKGVPESVLRGFLREYKNLVVDEEKIMMALTGGAHDISWFNRWLESYSSSNDVVVGPLAMFIENEKTQVRNIVWNDSLKFRNKLEKLLPAVGWSKLTSIKLREKMGFKDKVFWVDKDTNKPIEKEVWSYLGAFKDYRYHYDLLEYNLEEAKKTQDPAKIADAQLEFDQFQKDYMWQEYVPEFYEQDEIFKTSEVGKLAYYVRKQKLQAVTNLQNRMENELERFQEYDTIKAAWRDYQQLFSLNYEDGTPKVDDPSKGIFDKSIAEILIKHREATREFFEWRPIEGLLQSAYNEFVDLLATKNITPENQKEFDRELQKWQRQNLTLRFTDEYYASRSELINELAEIQSRIKEERDEEFNVAEAYRTIYNLTSTYRNEMGEPDAEAMGNEKLKQIRDLHQQITEFQEKFDATTGLTRDQSEELDLLMEKARNGTLVTGSLEADRYFYLLDLQEGTGISAEDTVRMKEIFAELGGLTATIPTLQYMDILNYNLSKLEIKEVSIDDVDEFINDDKFQEILDSDKAFEEWFLLNHYVKMKWDSDAEALVEKYVPTNANVVKIARDESHMEYTEIEGRDGEKVKLLGVPSLRHSIRVVKDEYRTIPFGAQKSDYVGQYINNKSQWLPRLYDPNSKYSAKDARFMNERYFQMKSANNAEYKLLEAITEYHLANQKGISNYSKLYLDMPRYAIKKGDVWQAIQKGTYGARFSELGKNVQEWYKQALGKSVVDAELDYNYNPENNLVNTDLNGDQISYVPVSGIYNLDIENTDADIIQGLIRYATSVAIQSKLLESLPIANSILSTMEDPANAPKEMEKFDKNIWTLKGQLQKARKKFSTNNRLGQVKSLIEREYYGKLVEGIEETHPGFGKWMQSLQGLSAMGSLAVNIPSDLKNKYGAYIQVIQEAIGGEFITLKDFALSRPWAEKAMLEWTTRGIYQTGAGAISTQLIQIFDPTFRYKDEMGREIERSMVKDLANFEWMYMHRKFGEMQVAMALFSSFMYGQKIDQVLSDGTKKSIRYVEAWEKDEDGIIRLKPGIHPGWSNLPVYHEYVKGETLEQIAKKYYIPVEELKAKNRIKSEIQLEDGQELIIAKSELFMGLKNRIQGTSRKLFGAYDDFGQPEGNKLLLYRLFFFMRKWFTPMFMNRFAVDTKTFSWKEGGGERYDWATGSYGKGFYITSAQVLYKVLRSKFRDAAYLSTEEKVALRKLSAEGLFAIGLSLLALMLFGFDPDDDDKWDRIRSRSGALNEDTFNTYGFLANHMLLLLMGVQAESTAFVPLPSIKGVNLGADDYVKMITQTSSSWYNTVVLYIDILGDIIDFITFQEMDRYKKDAGTQSWKQKDELKIWGKFRKVVGRTGGTDDPRQMIENLLRGVQSKGG